MSHADDKYLPPSLSPSFPPFPFFTQPFEPPLRPLLKRVQRLLPYYHACHAWIDTVLGNPPPSLPPSLPSLHALTPLNLPSVHFCSLSSGSLPTTTRVMRGAM